VQARGKAAATSAALSLIPPSANLVPHQRGKEATSWCLGAPFTLHGALSMASSPDPPPEAEGKSCGGRVITRIPRCRVLVITLGLLTLLLGALAVFVLPWLKPSNRALPGAWARAPNIPAFRASALPRLRRPVACGRGRALPCTAARDPPSASRSGGTWNVAPLLLAGWVPSV
jgi:hypothetical protein